MYNGKKILAIIPARGGSKGLPKKNIKEMNGKPLIYWTIKRAKESKYIDNIYISTDSAEIAEICDKVCNKKVEQLRPDELAKDSTSSAEVIKYTIEYLESEGKTYDYVILLEPTSPLRKEDDIDNIIKLACDNPQRDGVISLGEVHMEHPLSVKKISENGNIVSYCKKKDGIYQRQQLDLVYFPYGVAYLIKTKVLLEYMSVYTDNIAPYYIERWQTYEVDDIYDFICIEAIMKSRECINDYNS
jgi:CMP-N-acetylneuraminic acid synthetase